MNVSFVQKLLRVSAFAHAHTTLSGCPGISLSLRSPLSSPHRACPTTLSRPPAPSTRRHSCAAAAPLHILAHAASRRGRARRRRRRDLFDIIAVVVVIVIVSHVLTCRGVARFGCEDAAEEAAARFVPPADFWAGGPHRQSRDRRHCCSCARHCRHRRQNRGQSCRRPSL